ncbi:undecaprenyl diphosphate synthase, partial [Acidithiobacillus sp. GGI-221]
MAGHRRGAEVVREMVQSCADLGIPYLTLFAFSTENWRRPAIEVRLLMNLFRLLLRREARKLHENGVRLRIIGDRSALDPEICQLIDEAEALTRNNQRLQLNLAVNYGGRWDIAQAARAAMAAVQRGTVALEDFSAAHIARHLCLADIPEPDLLIRTGGEERISNFLLWQLAYTEFYSIRCGRISTAQLWSMRCILSRIGSGASDVRAIRCWRAIAPSATDHRIPVIPADPCADFSGTILDFRR